jgi:hypothetical protein
MIQGILVRLALLEKYESGPFRQQINSGMTIRKFKLPDPRTGFKDLESPKHPGDPAWITSTEWRKQQDPKSIEIPRTLESSSRSFGLDSSGWGAVNQDANGSGWGAASPDASGNGWDNADQWGATGGSKRDKSGGW